MEQKLLADISELNAYLCRLGVKKPFLICGRSCRDTELYRYFASKNAAVFDGFSPNPTDRSAQKAVKLFKETACDGIAALGGGSAIDVAKCVKLWAAAPLIAIPTTAGAGSEATHFAAIYRDGEKTSVADPRCLPDAVMFDPTLLETLPEYHRKASMLDALCHGLESFWARGSTAESREYASRAVRMVLQNMTDYLANSPSGNAKMQQAAYLAGKAINISRTTAGHAMSYKLTTIYGIAHGHAAALCNTPLWPYMVKNSTDSSLHERFVELAKLFDRDKVDDAVRRFQGIVSDLKLGVPKAAPEDYAVLRESVNLERLENNPMPLDKAEIDLLYHQISGGVEA